MNVPIANAIAAKFVTLYKAEYLIGFRDSSHRQLLWQVQNRRAVRQTATGHFADDKLAHAHRITFRRFDQQTITATKMIDPHGAIDENPVLTGWLQLPMQLLPAVSRP